MPLFQHRFGGHCASGDIFVFSWWSDSAGDIESVQNAAVTWATTFWGGYDSLTTPDVGMDTVRTGLIDMATGQQQELAEDGVSLVGVAVGNALPADCAIVCSLRSNLANRRGRGRFYLPQPAASTLAADGRMATGINSDVADALLSAWQGFAGTGSPVVYSRVNRTTQVVTTFNVGDIFDTQRRRENSLVESRQSRTMP